MPAKGKKWTLGQREKLLLKMKSRKYVGTPRPNLAEFNKVRGERIRKQLLSEPDKLCRMCGERKPRELFSKNKGKYDGRQSSCRECLKPLNRQQINKRWDSAKELVFQRYGRICAICGFSDERALQIDHINGGGVKSEGKGRNAGYTYLIKVVNAPDGQYQVLCANCNWIKRCEKNERQVRK